MVLGRLDCHMQNNEVGALPNTIEKNQLKWVERWNNWASSGRVFA
jgi:hypothetical protein